MQGEIEGQESEDRTLMVLVASDFPKEILEDVQVCKFRDPCVCV